MSVAKNQIVELEITSLTAQGSGIGRIEGMAVFVPATAQGDVIRAKILKVAKNYAFGKIEEILCPSPDRVVSQCPQFPKCGGCLTRHISYEAELKAKEQQVKDALTRIGGFSDLEVLPIIGADHPDHYRNKAQLPVAAGADGGLHMGFYAPHSHRVVDAQTCLLQPEIFRTVTDTVRQWAEKFQPQPYDERTHTGKFRHLYIRYGEKTGEVMVCLVVNGNGLKGEQELVRMLRETVPGLKSVVVNHNRERTNVILGKKCRTIWGQDFITDELCGLRFKISPLSFYQVNRSQAERLYGIAKKYAGLTGKETLLDLYCGTGTIGLTMADQAKEIIGVEIVEQAVADAWENARRNGIPNARFLCADAPKAAEQLAKEGVSPDVIVLDPPRKGCGEELVQVAAGMNPKRIVYVSCDPATLARDLKYFAQRGYAPRQAVPVDLFPRTGHVETVVLLSKLKVDHHIEIELKMDELDLTAAESKATYDEIKAYVLNKYGLKVSQLYIAQIKRKCGIIERKNYNVSKKEDAKVPQCPPEKEAAIMDALKHFQMI